jgi:hypothetical protein
LQGTVDQYQTTDYPCGHKKRLRDREFQRSYRPKSCHGPILAAIKIEIEQQGQMALEWAKYVGYHKQNFKRLKVQMRRMSRRENFTEIKWIVPEHSSDPPLELKRLFIQAAEPPHQEDSKRKGVRILKMMWSSFQRQSVLGIN